MTPPRDQQGVDEIAEKIMRELKAGHAPSPFRLRYEFTRATIISAINAALTTHDEARAKVVKKCPHCGRPTVWPDTHYCVVCEGIVYYDKLPQPSDEAREHLGNLLAIIHGDGGHYQAEHGNEKATTDAIAKYYELRAKHDEALPGDWTVVPVDTSQPTGMCFIRTREGGKLRFYLRYEQAVAVAAAHNSALRSLVDALRKAQRELIQVQPHIPQSCYPGHEKFIDAHLDVAREAIDKALQPYTGQKEPQP